MDKLSQKEHNLAAKFLSVQNELNMKLSPEWTTKGWAYPDAMMVEAVEAYNHLNWEWWRAVGRPVDWDQVKLEIVDVAHFLFSEIIAEGYSEDFTRTVAEEIRYEKDYEIDPEPSLDRVKISIKAFTRAILIYENAKAQKAEKTEKGMALFSALDIFLAIVWNLGLTIPQFFTLFIGKVCLNQLRWKNGYKKGIYGAQDVSTPEMYIKTWNGEEDNVWLANYAATLNPQSETFKEELLAGLEAKYAEVYRDIWEIREFDDVV